MEKYERNSEKETLFVGIDLHLRSWHVTGILEDTEVFSKGIPGTFWNLKRVVIKYVWDI